jgi:hypothetical protein
MGVLVPVASDVGANGPVAATAALQRKKLLDLVRNTFRSLVCSRPSEPCASTQNQSLSDLLFQHHHVLASDIGDLGKMIRIMKPKRLPVVMARDEAKSVAPGTWSMASGSLGQTILDHRLAAARLKYGALAP